jgi:hypothetical protein
MSRAQKPRVFAHSAAGDQAAAAAAAPGQNFVQQGTTDHFVVFYDDSLGADGPTLADAVLASCERDYAQLQTWFGNIAINNLPFNVFIQPGTSGASHATCADTSLFCDAFTGTDVDLVRSLVVAEADEVFMDNQNRGWNCGFNNGEALSRVLAAAIYPAELKPPGTGVTFATAERYLNSNRDDFVNQNDESDQNFESIGCGTLFINWLRFQLGFTLDQIVQNGGATLAETYQNLTGQADGFQRFSDLLAGRYPPDQGPFVLADDNPFPL